MCISKKLLGDANAPHLESCIEKQGSALPASSSFPSIIVSWSNSFWLGFLNLHSTETAIVAVASDIHIIKSSTEKKNNHCLEVFLYLASGNLHFFSVSSASYLSPWL